MSLLRVLRIFLTPLVIASTTLASVPVPGQVQSTSEEVEHLRQTVIELEARVAALEQGKQPAFVSGATGPQAAADLTVATASLKKGTNISEIIPVTTVSGAAEPLLPGMLPGGATINYTLDGYYEYNFNHPIGRVNLLRAYDVSSNSFSINQADVIFELAPDVSAGRRFGARLDLQFGQATSTSQGNPANEARPDVWRNIFQAYGTYVVPVGSGLTVDFGKWASSLGIEGNYTKDQMNYSRSYFFNYLPYYHMGFRTNYKFNDKVAVNYWVVNGAQQTEDTNGFKDQLFGFALQPAKAVSWTTNYYFGQDHSDTTPSGSCTEPLQPGLCAQPLSPAPNGKLHIFDTYATWQAVPNLTIAGEADYVIERTFANAALSHVTGGAAYAQYKLSSRNSLAARGEYLSDRGGLFSNNTQALKEATATWQYRVGDGLETFLEFRRDWSNRQYFFTDTAGVLSSDQNTATLGMVWWYGGKQGAW